MNSLNETHEGVQANQWWCYLLACPWCGAGLNSEIAAAKGACFACGEPYTVTRNRLNWSAIKKEPGRSIFGGGSMKIAAKAFNPMVNPLSPLRQWSDYQTRRYYRRTIHDPSLAEEWSHHYLSGLNLPKNAIVLEHGCGKGRHLGMLRQLGFRAAGQDIVYNDWWSNLPDCGLQVVPPECGRLPWTSGSFDLLLNVGVLGFIPPEELEAFTKEVCRVLKPGGVWIILEANESSYGWKHFQQPLVNLNSMKSIAASCRFSEIDSSYEGFYSPVFPSFINFVRKQCSPIPMNGYDADSWLANITPPERRGHWLLRLRRAD